jgi:hypothetical protein
MVRTGFIVRELPRLRVWISTPSPRVWFRLLQADAISVSAAAIVREHICEPLRPGVYAEWADPRERFVIR